MKNVTSSSTGGTELPEYSQVRSPAPLFKTVKMVVWIFLDSFRPALDGFFEQSYSQTIKFILTNKNDEKIDLKVY